MADEVVDAILPDELDWMTLVRSYPLVSLAVAIGAGFWLGRTHGRTIVGGVADAASQRVTKSVEALLDQG